VTLKKVPAAAALDGYEDVQPMVYCGLFPTDADDYQARDLVARSGVWGLGLGVLCAARGERPAPGRAVAPPDPLPRRRRAAREQE
jgi:hypothetical protein